MYILCFFNDTATTEIYTLSLHDALPICTRSLHAGRGDAAGSQRPDPTDRAGGGVSGTRTDCQHRYGAGVAGPVSRSPADRKSTRLNSSHANISYAVFCLKTKKNIYLLIV